MPPYVTLPDSSNSPVLLLQPGVPAYALGSKKNGPTCKMVITQVAITGNVATVTVKIIEGDIPTTSGLITITGTTTAGGAFNVSGVAITGVSITASTGVGTITFALTHANVAPTADSGMGYVPVPEVAEALVNESTQAFAVQEVAGPNENGRTITWSTAYPSAPGAVTVKLQASLVDIDSQYSQLDSSTNVGGETRMITLTNERFLRANISGVSGGSNPTGIIKLLI